MKDPDHILVILAALVIVLGAYCLIFLVGDANPKFLEGAAVGLAGAIAGFAGRTAGK